MSDTRKISITEGLRELKLYDAKIMKAIDSVQFIGAAKKSSDKIGTFKKENFIDYAKSGYQSVVDLIENRSKLKAAIVQSNAETNVEIGGVIYTVAQAIERKSSIVYEKTLLESMKAQYAKSSATVEKENKRVDAQIDQLLEGFLSKDSDKKVSESDLAAISEPYREKNEFHLVDPLNLYEKIQKLEDEISRFEAEVDVKLSISNSITYIEI